jgi:hypothetical protein
MKKMMMAGWTGTLMMLVTVGSLRAHHSLTQFDTTTAVRVKGTVVLFQRVNPHSLLLLKEKRDDGQTRQWVVEGPGAFQLTRMKIGYDAMKAGDTVEVCGYVTKPGVESQRTISTEPISASLKATTAKSVSGSRMDGELLVMPDGQKKVWSDYGHHKCLAADYIDVHSK